MRPSSWIYSSLLIAFLTTSVQAQTAVQQGSGRIGSVVGKGALSNIGKGAAALGAAKAAKAIIKNPLRTAAKAAVVGGVAYAAAEATRPGRMELGAKEQAEVEGTKLWQDHFSRVKNMADSIDMKNDNQSKCSKVDLKKLSLKHNQFRTLINNNLPHKQSNPSDVGDINAYGVIRQAKSIVNTDKDHIPSFKAIQFYLEQNGLYSKEFHSDLKDNASAIAIPRVLHRRGRTYGGGNSNFYNNDSKNLRLATIKDVATLLYSDSVQNNGKSFTKILSGSAILYARNRALCLYQEL